jgi:hypothetical protein
VRTTLAIEQWRAGDRFVERLDEPTLRRVQPVLEATYAELRRRLGSAFTVDELVELYEAGGGWALDLASRLAPEHPETWDARIVDAAFHQYLRQAQDWGGGRFLALDRGDED